MISVIAHFYFSMIYVVRISYFDNDFASQMRLAELPSIHCVTNISLINSCVLGKHHNLRGGGQLWLLSVYWTHICEYGEGAQINKFAGLGARVLQ